jgi:hypothetical protein
MLVGDFHEFGGKSSAVDRTFCVLYLADHGLKSLADRYDTPKKVTGVVVRKADLERERKWFFNLNPRTARFMLEQLLKGRAKWSIVNLMVAIVCLRERVLGFQMKPVDPDDSADFQRKSYDEVLRKNLPHEFGLRKRAAPNLAALKPLVLPGKPKKRKHAVGPAGRITSETKGASRGVRLWSAKEALDRVQKENGGKVLVV